MVSDMKKKVLLVHATQKEQGRVNRTAFRDVVARKLSDEAELETCSLNDLLYMLDGENTFIRDTQSNHDISDFDLVIFRTIGKFTEEAIALAAYCRKKSIAYIDDYIPTVGDDKKLSCAFIYWEHDLPVPKTLYGPTKSVIAEIGHIGLPAIVKDNDGKKGRDNYLAKNIKEIENILTKEGAPRFVLQNYIPNEGDYRILVLNGTSRLAIRRVASGDSHLNNTSQGGDAQQVELSTLPRSVIEIVEKATAIDKLSVAGADIIIDKETQQPYILEVNRAPQITTGAVVNAKVDAYAAAISELLKGTEPHSDAKVDILLDGMIGTFEEHHMPPTTQGRVIVGRKENITLTAFPGVSPMMAKIDTGAYSNALHVEYLKEIIENGQTLLRFSPTGKDSDMYETPHYTTKKVISSNGIAEERFKVDLDIKIKDTVYKGQFTLSDRSRMRVPILIGRKFLNDHHFLVDSTRRFTQ